jgi:hypothetical protein
LVEEERLADVFDFGDCAFEVEGFGEDYFEDLEGSLSIMLIRSWVDGG